jgi:hypothetical protein
MAENECDVCKKSLVRSTFCRPTQKQQIITFTCNKYYFAQTRLSDAHT